MIFVAKAKSMAKLAKAASIEFSFATSEKKNSALKTLANLLIENKDKILAENLKDVKAAEKSRLADSMVKRLKLDEEKIKLMQEEVLSVSSLQEPAGKTLSSIELDKGLELFQVSVPIGVICCIFESRPDVLIQILALCIKSGNSALLKGGSEAMLGNKILFSLVKKALAENGLPSDAVQLLESREQIDDLLGMDDAVDLIIPRGSSGLVKYIQNHTRIPVLGHSSGICHIFVDSGADLQKAEIICIDAKTQYPAVCNAMETMVVHSAIAEKFLPSLCKKLQEKCVPFYADEKAAKILRKNGIASKKATEKSWVTEYSDLKLNIKIADSLLEAIQHINKYGSRHTDSIITENKENALKFVQLVDSADVFWNASTRFSDGYRYGKGAEVGINTGKIHARGPSGIESLMTYKYILTGKGDIVADYVGKNAKKFTHKPLQKDWMSGFL